MNFLQRRFYIYSAVFLVLLAVMFVVHLGTGFTGLSYGDIARILLGGGTPEERLTLFDFRMVRSVLAILIGAGLALSGLIFQTISRNELASPGLLGVNAGAAAPRLFLGCGGVVPLGAAHRCDDRRGAGSNFHLSDEL